jgi:probable phosphoglycerate mutase
MEVIIARHGQSEENHLGIIQGRLPGKLSEIGISQVEKLGEKLSQKKIDVIYCSPINRCVETYNLIKKYIDPSVPVFISELIQERDFGEFSGKNINEVDFNKINDDNEINKNLGIEQLNQVYSRTKNFWEDIKTKHYNQSILVIGHSISLRMLIANILDKDYSEVLENFRIKNASISIFEINEESKPIIINDTEFLK